MANAVSFELLVAGHVPGAEVVRRLDALRDLARSLDVSSVTPLWRVVGKELLVEPGYPWPAPPGKHLTLRPFDRERDESRSIDLAGFMVRPSNYSPQVVFALLRPLPAEEARRADDRHWSWGFRCDKLTMLGRERLLRLLDAARRMGFSVTAQ
jgi:hypothetical protein